jgi:hypothetical protein
MSKFIHTVPTGVTNSPFGVAGSIIGVATLNIPGATAANFNNAGMIASGIAFAQIPDDAFPQVGAILGAALAAGTGNSAFVTSASLTAGMTLPPVDGTVFNGTEWTRPGGGSAGRVATLTITTAGTGYSTSTGSSTIAKTGEGTLMTMDITSVGASGEVTGVSVGDAGYLFKVGDEVVLRGGANNCVLEVASITYPKIATFNTGRTTASPNALSPSKFTLIFPGLTGERVYLYQPTTEARVYYDDSLSGDFRFSSGSVDIFDGADFSLEVKTVNGDITLATVTVPESDTNVDVDLNSAL